MCGFNDYKYKGNNKAPKWKTHRRIVVVRDETNGSVGSRDWGLNTRCTDTQCSAINGLLNTFKGTRSVWHDKNWINTSTNTYASNYAKTPRANILVVVIVFPTHIWGFTDEQKRVYLMTAKHLRPICMRSTPSQSPNESECYHFHTFSLIPMQICTNLTPVHAIADNNRSSTQVHQLICQIPFWKLSYMDKSMHIIYLQIE